METGASLDNGKGYYYGATPLRGCMSEITARFEREARREKNVKRDKLLLIVSDGDPTDGNPKEFSERMEKFGIQIAGAFITDRDVQGPRLLANETKTSWLNGARLMFDWVSKADRTISEYGARGAPDYDRSWRLAFEKAGWTVPAGARLFAHVNQFEILADYMRLIASTWPMKELLQTTP
jgi:hypothetical protein